MASPRPLLGGSPAAFLFAIVTACSPSVDVGTGSGGGDAGVTDAEVLCPSPGEVVSWPSANGTSEQGAPGFSTGWAESLGSGADTAEGDSLFVDGSGFITVSGGHGDPIDLGPAGTLAPISGRFLARFDPSGKPIWGVELPGAPTMVVGDGPGNSWVAGVDEQGLSVIERYDAAANLILHRTLDLPGIVVAPIVDKGGVIGAAPLALPVDLGFGPLTPMGGDLAVFALAPAGNTVWATSLGKAIWPDGAPSPGSVISLVDLVARPGGGAIVLVRITTACTAGPAIEEALVWIGESGGVARVQREPPSDQLGPGALLAVAPDGTLAFTRNGPLGIIIASLGPQGEHRFSRLVVGDTGVTRPSFTAKGTIVFGGEVHGSINVGGGPLQSAPGNFAIFVAELSATGAHLASRVFPVEKVMGSLTAGESRAEALTIAPSGRVLFTGFYSGNLDLGVGPLPAVPVKEGPYHTRVVIASLGL